MPPIFQSRVEEFFRFSAVGFFAVLAYLFFYQYFLAVHISGPIANTLSYVCSICIGYFLNSKFSFKKKIGFKFFSNMQQLI